MPTAGDASLNNTKDRKFDAEGSLRNAARQKGVLDHALQIQEGWQYVALFKEASVAEARTAGIQLYLASTRR